MSVPVTIENDALRIEVFPQFGGKVSSIVDKSDKFELLFDYAAELPTSSQYDRPYAEGWHAGWDECFPAVAAGPYPGHPYHGIGVPDHGELWGLPAAAAPTRDGIITQWNGLRFGYVFSRKLYLDGPSIAAEYTVQNLAPFEFRFVWAQHALLSLAEDVEIDIGAVACRLSHDAQGREYDADIQWPTAPDGAELSRPMQLPAKHGWKIFTQDPIAIPATVTYPARGRRLTMEYSAPTGGPGGYWGIWINTGAWLGHRHFAIEPTTGRHDQLDRSARDGSAAVVPPNGKSEWTVRWTVGRT